MHPDPSEFKDLTPEQINCYIALRKNLHAATFMQWMLGLFGIILLSAVFAAFAKEYAFASIMGIVDGVLGFVIRRIARFYFPLQSD